MKKQNYWMWLFLSSVATSVVNIGIFVCFGWLEGSFLVKFGLDLLLSELIVILILYRLITASDRPVSRGKCVLFAVLGQFIKAFLSYVLLFIYIRFIYLNVNEPAAGNIDDCVEYALDSYTKISIYSMFLRIYIVYYLIYLFCSTIAGIVIGLALFVLQKTIREKKLIQD
ncbi:hypothetical protein [Coprobacter tertius]|uniref:DUF4199 domain-containing protein n=1 Tax=Coprobacter tertius TaxID=2944915 RepID=A0ABT1MDZ9_9BACT|nr:hypothetical protein [Coprobacter tertius]MCP9610864.1 hypothetical protein [Coprobacter tertius]